LQAIEELARERPELSDGLRRRMRLLLRTGLLEEPAERGFPERLGDFRLLSPLGGGGMGTVYLARQESLGREVALKVVRADLLFFPDARRRFQREAEVVARLEHPGIVPVHDVGTLPDGRLYYVMKLVQGERLDAVASRVETVSERLRLLIRVADAAAFAHAHGVVHRDLTPANIMVGAFGEVLLVDWGLALVQPNLPHQPTQSHGPNQPNQPNQPSQPNPPVPPVPVVAGTPGFMAPEQARGIAGTASDVYALGALLAWWLSPERGGPARMPRPLASIAARAMAADPAARYPTADALAADLARYLDGQRVTAHRETLGERAQRFTRRYRVAILLVVGYLLMRIGLLMFRGL
jgi:serine/threonine protein kinase